MRWVGALVGLLLAALPAQAAPQRVVSLDYCADQYVLKFVPREAIVALSPDSRAAFSGLREEALNIPQVRPVAEDVLALEPDLIVRSYGGGPMASRFFERADVPVVNLGFASDLASVKATIRRVSTELGAQERGQAVVAEMDARLSAIEPNPSAPETLYLTPGGAVPGTGTQVDELLRLAGLKNFETRTGWHMLPLEALAYRRPAHIAAAFFDDPSQRLFLWSAAAHPVAKRQLRTQPVTPLKSAWTTCGSWTLVDAVEALAGAPEGTRGSVE